MSELRNEIQKQIKLASYGEAGEKNIAFELKNSGMDMYILHDIYLEYGDMSAQIDYLIITRKCNFVIECKNLIGNIEIDSQGNFIRTYELFEKKVKEGIYSPITQNERHLNVLKNVRKNGKSNFITKTAFEHFFDDYYKSLIVLANPKTYLNSKYAKKDIKDKVIRADQLITKISQINAESRNPVLTNDEMLDLGNFFLSANKPERSDYIKKYIEFVKEIENCHATAKNTENIKKPLDNMIEPNEKKCPKCGARLILRTATKGNNIGKKFYGCVAFPNCRYVENI